MAINSECSVLFLQSQRHEWGNATGAVRQDAKLSVGEALEALSAGGGMCRSP